MNLATPAEATQFPDTPGTPFEGGFYAGRIRVGAQVFALIVAPKADGETTNQWQHTETDLQGAVSYCDGLANTEAMALWASPIALWARTLNINGFNDWYIPARDELELLYRHLKPTTDANYVWRSGDNPSSLPAGYPYTKASPVQTPAQAFQPGGVEAFDDIWYWSSTQYSRGLAWGQYFDGGLQFINAKSFQGRARAVRRLVIE